MRVCRVCMTAKPLDQFHRRAGVNAFRRECKDCRKAVDRLRNFGITERQYQHMLEQQGGVCAICHRHFTGKRNEKFAVDHDHSTGEIRGLLCPNCNTGLGLFKDDPRRLASAIKYLGSK